MNLREKQVGAISDLSDGPWAVELICSFACDGDVCVGDGEALVGDGAWVVNDLSINIVSPQLAIN